MLQRFRAWWSTARSSVITHRRVKWLTLLVWALAEPFHYIDSVRYLTHASMFFGFYSVWTAEEAAKAELRVEEAQEISSPDT